MTAWNPKVISPLTSLLLAIALLCPLEARAEEASWERASRIEFGITGEARGDLNPTNLLALPVVQAITQRLASGPMPRLEVERQLESRGLSIDSLIRAGIVRREGPDLVAIDLVWLDEGDRLKVTEVAREHAVSLASSILGNEAILESGLRSLYREGVSKEEVRFSVIGCMLLNWSSLLELSGLGYIAPPVDHGELGRYEVWARAGLPSHTRRGVFNESHTETHGALSFTTFGDSVAPRSAVPDLLWRIDSVIDVRATSPSLKRMLTEAVSSSLHESIVHMSTVLVELRNGPRSISSLKSKLPSGASLDRGIALGSALGYIRVEHGIASALIPVFTLTEDSKALKEVLSAGNKLVYRWIDSNYSGIQQQLSGLSAIKQGIAYPRIFNKVWHEIFGWTSYYLAQKQWIANPYGPSHPRPGYVSFAWEPSLELFRFR